MENVESAATRPGRARVHSCRQNANQRAALQRLRVALSRGYRPA